MLANILERLENDEAVGFLSEMDLSKAARTIESMENRRGDGDSFRAGPQEKKRPSRMHGRDLQKRSSP